MDYDGIKVGFVNEVLVMVLDNLFILVIVFGGVGMMEYFYDVFIEGKVDVGLVVSIFYFQEIEIGDLKGYLKDKGVFVRGQKLF